MPSVSDASARASDASAVVGERQPFPTLQKKKKKPPNRRSVKAAAQVALERMRASFQRTLHAHGEDALLATNITEHAYVTSAEFQALVRQHRVAEEEKKLRVALEAATLANATTSTAAGVGQAVRSTTSATADRRGKRNVIPCVRRNPPVADAVHPSRPRVPRRPHENEDDAGSARSKQHALCADEEDDGLLSCSHRLRAFERVVARQQHERGGVDPHHCFSRSLSALLRHAPHHAHATDAPDKDDVVRSADEEGWRVYYPMHTIREFRRQREPKTTTAETAPLPAATTLFDALAFGRADLMEKERDGLPQPMPWFASPATMRGTATWSCSISRAFQHNGTLHRKLLTTRASPRAHTTLRSDVFPFALTMVRFDVFSCAPRETTGAGSVDDDLALSCVPCVSSPIVKKASSSTAHGRRVPTASRREGRGFTRTAVSAAPAPPSPVPLLSATGKQRLATATRLDTKGGVLWRRDSVPDTDEQRNPRGRRHRSTVWSKVVVPPTPLPLVYLF